MDLQVLQGSLARGLAIVSGGVAIRPTLPVLSHVLLRASKDNGGLLLAATNLELIIACQTTGKIEKEFAFTVPARGLSDYVNLLPQEIVEIEHDGSLWLRTAGHEAKFRGIDAQEFPLIPTIDPGLPMSVDPEVKRVTIQPDVLAKMLAQVGIAVSNEEIRPALTGVYFVFDGEYLTMAAADGFRLSVSKVSGIEAPAPFEAIVPGKALDNLARLLKEEKEPVQIEMSPARNQIIFRLAGDAGANEGKIRDIRLISQLIEGQYPDCNQIVPKSHETRATVATSDLLKAFKSAHVFARQETGVVTMDVAEEGGITISATSAEMGNTEIEVDAEVEGGAITIAFNVVYLLDAIKVMDAGSVIFEASSPARPGVFYQADRKDEFLYVAMPVHVRSG